MIVTPIKGNFIYPEVKETDYRFGAIQTPIVREDGDWRDYLPPTELQRRNGIESSSCFIEAQQHAIATIQEETFDIPDLNYSARFNLIYSDASPFGGDPLKGAQSFRHNGLIPDSMLPFSDEVKSWSDFCSFLGGNERTCIASGQQFLKRWKLNWLIVFERFESKETKDNKLREALKRGPVPMSVPAWYLKDGKYFRPDGERDNHMVTCVYMDKEGYKYVFDTYDPFIKILDKDINPEFAMRWTVNKLSTQTVSPGVFAKLIMLLKSLGIKFNV